MAEEYRYKRREFLNEDESLAGFIIATVPKKSSSRDTIYSNLTIGDCSERIYLDFGYSGKTEKEALRKKLALFKSIINEFVEAVEAEMDKSVRTRKK